jgi:hypothetical protein
MVAAVDLDRSRTLLGRRGDHLKRVPPWRIRPLGEEVTAIHKRLAGLQRLIEADYLEERTRGVMEK